MVTALTMAEREAHRQRLRDRAMAHALDSHVTARCRWATEGGLQDHGCTGGLPGRSGCLCPCHDEAAELSHGADGTVTAEPAMVRGGVIPPGTSIRFGPRTQIIENGVPRCTHAVIIVGPDEAAP